MLMAQSLIVVIELEQLLFSNVCGGKVSVCVVSVCS